MSGDSGRATIRATVLRGGVVHDPETGVATGGDVRLADGIISNLPAAPSDDVIDVTGFVVAPGLVDLHTHVFSGQDLGVPADDIAFPSGTTTIVDAGSAGAHLIGAFRATAVERSSVRIRALLNISSIGTTSIRLGGELASPWYVSEDAAVEAIEANRDFVFGVKVRASADVGGAHTRAALAAARRVADHVDLPLMVHLGPAPAGVDEIVDTLRAGDILTHAFTGWEGNTVLGEDGRVRRSVRAARERGVLLDVGHGMSGFSFEVARRMIAEGQQPDTVSTDIHTYSRDIVVDLPTVMSKFLALGMPFADVLRSATVTAAAAARSDAGTLRPGRPADVVVLERVPGRVEYDDAFGGSAVGGERLRVVMTYAGGRLEYDGRRLS
ncbi:hypothetical protein ASD65_10580 [Microbacterium sp. Root61]|uniref:amidohydrolase family protein n=1 Tax=Microbacterium sp. Root61 TaxID=1736570 RepID=UPI0007003524|nr:amidohydrolase family protein [Microbacterium sp. Root61]KRA24818.1 hypothetical protein ASD65_10580 [Microbacterium sp. Root61]